MYVTDEPIIRGQAWPATRSVVLTVEEFGRLTGQLQNAGEALRDLANGADASAAHERGLKAADEIRALLAALPKL